MHFILFVFLCSVGLQLAYGKKETVKDANDNKGNTPFFLQDPEDEMCLGPHGFTMCDERTVWVLTKRVGKKKTYSLVSLLNPLDNGMCLEQQGFGGYDVGMGACSKSGSKSWEFEFVNKHQVRLSANGKCLDRKKKKYSNQASLVDCNGGNEYLPLIYHPTNIGENGFYLKAADGKCFDGSKFRTCQSSSKLLWGVGIKYIWEKAYRYFYNIEDSSKCISQSGSKVQLGDCTSSSSLKWGLSDGKLSSQNGKMCIARLVDDSAVMEKCQVASEYITMDVPKVYTEDDLKHLLLNQENLTGEEKQALAQLVQHHKYSSN